MAENLTSGYSPTFGPLKNQLATLYGADGIEDLASIDNQRVGIYINQAYRECYAPADGFRPEWAVANYGFVLPASIKTDVTYVQNSNSMTLTDVVDPKYVGSYIDIGGEFYTIAEVSGNNIKTLIPWIEASGQSPATVYHNSFELDREVIDVCDPPEVVGWGVLSAMHGKEQEIGMRSSLAGDFLPSGSQHYGKVPSITSRGKDYHIDRPIWYFIDSSDLQVYSENSDTTDISKKALRNRFCVYPLPEEAQAIRLRANILPLELTNDNDVVRLPGNMAWDILFPIASAKLALSDPRYNGDNRESLLRLGEEAKIRMRSLSSSQKRKPMRLVKRAGY